MNLDGLKVAVLVTDGYEPSELTEPVAALQQAGATTTIISNHTARSPGRPRPIPPRSTSPSTRPMRGSSTHCSSPAA